MVLDVNLNNIIKYNSVFSVLSFEEQICSKNQREQNFIEKWCWLYDRL